MPICTELWLLQLLPEDMTLGNIPLSDARNPVELSIGAPQLAPEALLLVQHLMTRLTA